MQIVWERKEKGMNTEEHDEAGICCDEFLERRPGVNGEDGGATGWDVGVFLDV